MVEADVHMMRDSGQGNHKMGDICHIERGNGNVAQKRGRQRVWQYVVDQSTAGPLRMDKYPPPFDLYPCVREQGRARGEDEMSGQDADS